MCQTRAPCGFIDFPQFLAPNRRTVKHINLMSIGETSVQLLNLFVDVLNMMNDQNNKTKLLISSGAAWNIK